jgi:hypothetical protein
MEINFGSSQTPIIDVVATPVIDVVATPVESTPGLSGVGLTSGGKVVSPPATSLGVPTTINGDGGFILGDSLPGFSDIILPRLNIVQGVGLLKDSFPQGSIIYNQDFPLFTLPTNPIIDPATGNVLAPARPATAPINMTVIGFRPTRFVENVKGGARGIICNTESDVRAAGGTLDYNEFKLKEASGMKRFDTLAEAFVIIRRPEHVKDDDTRFTFLVDGNKYALALWAMKGTAYTHAAKRVFFTARKMGCLQKGGYPSWNYSISTRPETRNGNTYFVPVCIPNSPNTPQFLAFVRYLLNPYTAPDAGL